MGNKSSTLIYKDNINTSFSFFADENSEIHPFVVESYTIILNNLQQEEIKFGKIRRYLGDELFYKLNNKQKNLLLSTVGSIDLGFAPNYKNMFSSDLVSNEL